MHRGTCNARQLLAADLAVGLTCAAERMAEASRLAAHVGQEEQPLDTLGRALEQRRHRREAGHPQRPRTPGFRNSSAKLWPLVTLWRVLLSRTRLELLSGRLAHHPRV